MPDISYDLDGDGYVGNRDFVLAKVFDKDGDGKLNQTEKLQALEAIKNVSEKHIFVTENDKLGCLKQFLLGHRVIRYSSQVPYPATPWSVRRR